jgi:hypothetical protein
MFLFFEASVDYSKKDRNLVSREEIVRTYTAKKSKDDFLPSWERIADDLGDC